MISSAMRVAAFIGGSNSGKTTLICALVRHFVARGERVAAIKHTHHEVNAARSGDSGRFLEAGALPVILAGDRQAIVFHAGATERIAFDTPDALLAHVGAPSLVLVEGFKTFDGWPRFDANRITHLEDALSLLDRID